MWPFRCLRRTLTVSHSNRVLPANKIYGSGALFSTFTEGENKLMKLLKDKLNPTYLEVKDISGGCGAMYQITIGSEQFKGKRTLEQHKMVNQALGDEIKGLHGLTIQIHDDQ